MDMNIDDRQFYQQGSYSVILRSFGFSVHGSRGICDEVTSNSWLEHDVLVFSCSDSSFSMIWNGHSHLLGRCCRLYFEPGVMLRAAEVEITLNTRRLSPRSNLSPELGRVHSLRALRRQRRALRNIIQLDRHSSISDQDIRRAPHEITILVNAIPSQFLFAYFLGLESEQRH